MYWLFKQVPLAVVLIIAVLILLFGDYRKPTIVLCCIPLLLSLIHIFVRIGCKIQSDAR